ncbi:AcrR family transcriptional regulator [Mumia flava]|uniref:AcrR family transcriptional regulator n=1 Tax=Mumia flava TaxID=1348852 RepID=A0A2M9BHN3_9ACTN|nr:TetR/AcrR family transcriptional regulator [Mumia flava]PJJ57424.1 AcrR family transcriptional regulator [Mumia flava]
MEGKGWSTRVDVDRADSARRSELLAASRRVFERMGYGAATVADITREAGVSRATFYVYFASKQEVFTVLAEQVRDAFLDAQALADIPADDVERVFRTTIGAYLDVVVDHLALITVLDHQALEDAELNALWSDIQARAVDRMARYLTRVSDDGLAPLDLAARPRSIALMSGGQTESFAALVNAGTVSRDEAVEEMLAIVLRAIGLR